MADLTIQELTEATLDGSGVFDVLMRANKAHLENEFRAGRIKGPEYSTVYLGSLEAVMQTALAFLLQKRKNDLEAQLLEEQVANAKLEGKVLVAQECKLRAEYDLILKQIDKVGAEIDLLVQKGFTERAQTVGDGVDEDSVLGRQKNLYMAQAKGFERDAEQKAAKLMIDTWNVRRTTDESTEGTAENQLLDPSIGRAVTKLLQGINA